MEQRGWKFVVSVVVVMCQVLSVVPQGVAVAAETYSAAIPGGNYVIKAAELKAFVAPADWDVKAAVEVKKEEEKQEETAPGATDQQKAQVTVSQDQQPAVACPPNPPVPEGAKPVDPEHKQGYQDIFGTSPDKMFEETKDGVTTVTFYDATGKIIGTITKTPGSDGKEQPGVFKRADGTEIDLLERFGQTRGTAYQAYLLKALDPVTAASVLDEWMKNPGQGKFTDLVCFLDDTILTAEEVGKMLAKMDAANADKIMAALDTRGMTDRLDMTKVRQAMMTEAGIPAYPGADGDWNAYIKSLVDYMKGTTDAGLHQMAWDLINQSLKDPNSNGKIGWQYVQGIMFAMAGELQKLYRDSSYALNLDAIKATVVDAALNIVNSDAFKSMSDANKIGFSQAFTVLGVELTWRKPPADQAEAYNALYTKIGDFYKTLLGSGNSEYVTAYAFQNLMGLWRKGNWSSPEGNKEGVAAILKQAMTVEGGINALITSWQDGLANADELKLNGEQQAWLASALGQVIWQSAWLNAARKDGTAALTDEQMQTMAGVITDFLGKVNGGEVAITANMKNHFINVVGSALIVSMYFKEGANYKSVEAYQELGAAYMDLGNNLLTQCGGSVAYQTSVINVTASIWNHAKTTKNTDVATACQNLLFNKDFNADTYLKNATTQMGDAKLGSDYKAWVASGMNNLERVRLEFNKEVATQKIKNSIAAIKGWITDKNSLDNMREMGRQAGVYTSLAGLLKVFCKEGNKDLDNDATLRANIVAIFNTLVSDTQGTSVRDSLVRSMGKSALSALLTSLEGSKWTNLRADLDVVLKKL